MKLQTGQNASLIFPLGQFRAASRLRQGVLQLIGTSEISKKTRNAFELQTGQKSSDNFVTCFSGSRLK
jgi:hypothetical protein